MNDQAGLSRGSKSTGPTVPFVGFVMGNSYTPEGTFLPRKEGSFRGRKAPSAEGRFLYGRKLLNKFISKIIL